MLNLQFITYIFLREPFFERPNYKSTVKKSGRSFRSARVGSELFLFGFDHSDYNIARVVLSVDGEKNISRKKPRSRGATFGKNVGDCYHGSRHLLTKFINGHDLALYYITKIKPCQWPTGKSWKSLRGYKSKFFLDIFFDVCYNKKEYMQDAIFSDYEGGRIYEASKAF